jgi:transposase
MKGLAGSARALKLLPTTMNIQTTASKAKRRKQPQAQNYKGPIHEEIFLGLDAHSEHIRIVRQIDGSNPQPAQRMSWEGLGDFARKQLLLAKKVYAVYEAGPFGFKLQRDLQALGLTCYVTKACKLDPHHKRVQTDKTDARELCINLERYAHGNDRAMVVVRVPTPEQEAKRTEARHRKYLHKEMQGLRAHGRGILLHYGVRHAGLWWRQARWDQLAPGLNQELRAALEDCRVLIARYEELLKPVEKKLKAAAPQELPRGFGALTFVLLLREICEWQRFGNRRKVGSFFGLCGGVSSSGPQHFDLNITKAGNPYLRVLLIELAWRMVRWQPRYQAVQRWARVLQDPKCHRRHRKRAIVAIARQLAVDIWKWQTGKATPQDLGWEMNLAA